MRRIMADMHEEKTQGPEVGLYWNIYFSIDFQKRCICDYLIFSSLRGLELRRVLSRN